MMVIHKAIKLFFFWDDKKNKNVFTIVTKAEFQSNNFKCKKKKAVEGKMEAFFKY